MNYRHIYHAGGRADLVKHITLAHLMKRLAEKPAAFCVIDTHAAIGLYDLAAPEAQKTREAEEGVLAYRHLPHDTVLAGFDAVLDAYNPSGQMRYYPGSPALIRHFLRPQDRLIAIEKHPEDAAALKRFFGMDTQAHIHERDAWEAMKALIPVPETRLLVFIDPPFEKTDEMEQAFTAIERAYAWASSAVYALWYPIKDAVNVGRLHENLAASRIQKILRADVYFHAEIVPDRLNGCGMVIINPPWQIEDALQAAYGGLRPLFADGALAAKVDWVKE